MLETIGAIALTIIALVLIANFIGLPFMALGFGGPTLESWAWMVGGLVLSAGTVVGWWYLVGTNIHVGFG